MAIDPSVLGELDNDLGVAIRQGQQGQQLALERLRSGFDQDGRAIGAAIASVMVQASLPQQAMDDKLADRTPSPPAPPEPANLAK